MCKRLSTDKKIARCKTTCKKLECKISACKILHATFIASCKAALKEQNQYINSKNLPQHKSFNLKKMTVKTYQRSKTDLFVVYLDTPFGTNY